jgi:hypothetical protein
VTIRGRNLNQEIWSHVRLFKGICRRRVPWSQEADEPAVMEARNHDAGRGNCLVIRVA